MLSAVPKLILCSCLSACALSLSSEEFNLEFDRPFHEFADVDRLYQILVDALDYLEGGVPKSSAWHMQLERWWRETARLQATQTDEVRISQEELALEAAMKAPREKPAPADKQPTPLVATYLCLRCHQRYDTASRLKAHVYDQHMAPEMREALARVEEHPSAVAAPAASSVPAKPPPQPPQTAAAAAPPESASAAAASADRKRKSPPTVVAPVAPPRPSSSGPNSVAALLTQWKPLTDPTVFECVQQLLQVPGAAAKFDAILPSLIQKHKEQLEQQDATAQASKRQRGPEEATDQAAKRQRMHDAPSAHTTPPVSIGTPIAPYYVPQQVPPVEPHGGAFQIQMYQMMQAAWQFAQQQQMQKSLQNPPAANAHTQPTTDTAHTMMTKAEPNASRSTTSPSAITGATAAPVAPVASPHAAATAATPDDSAKETRPTRPTPSLGVAKPAVLHIAPTATTATAPLPAVVEPPQPAAEASVGPTVGGVAPLAISDDVDIARFQQLLPLLSDPDARWTKEARQEFFRLRDVAVKKLYW